MSKLQKTLRSFLHEAYLRKRVFFVIHLIVSCFLYWDHLGPEFLTEQNPQLLEWKTQFTHLFYLCYIILSSGLIVSHYSTLQLRLMLIPFLAFFTTFICIFTSIQLNWNPYETTIQSTAETYFSLAKFYSHIFIPILATAPLWICLELMFVGPAIRMSYVQKSFSTLTQYAIRSQSSSSSKETLDVLLLEDDITSADPLLKLYRKINLSCQHVSTIEEAEDIFEQQKDQLQILMLDIFIRVVDPSFPRTGLDWLRELNQEYPKGQRNFIVVIYTGHREILDKETLAMVDHVLPKPWNPREYLQYLADCKIFKVKNHA